MLPKFLLIVAAGAALGACSFSCSSAPELPQPTAPANVDEHFLGFESAERPSSVRQLWRKKIQGLITDMAISAKGNALLIATIPDPDNPTGRNQYRVSRFDHAGRQLWGIGLSNQVKSLAISDDGSLAVISHYGEQLVGLNASGATRWKFDGVCKPIILSRLKKVLCYHDDDAEPAVAFDVIGWDGARISSFPIRRDILALKVSGDETVIALGLNQGMFALVGTERFAPLWQRQVPGEIVDVAVRGGESPGLAVLYSVSKEKGTRKVAVFDSQGQAIGVGPVEPQVEQIEFDGQGRGVFSYGNGNKGQYLALYEPTEDKKLAERWRRMATRHADYSSSMIAARDLAIIGFEDNLPSTRHSHLLAFDREGKLRFNIPVVTQEGAYLYVQGFSEKRAFLGVGTDDSQLVGYWIGKD